MRSLCDGAGYDIGLLSGGDGGSMTKQVCYQRGMWNVWQVSCIMYYIYLLVIHNPITDKQLNYFINSVSSATEEYGGDVIGCCSNDMFMYYLFR